MEKTDLTAQANSFVINKNHINRKHIYLNNSLFQGEKIKTKKQVLKYLKSVSPSWFTSARVVDAVLNKTIEIPDHLYDDGFFIWSQSDIYHFEKYNMPLDETFIEYCLDKCNENF